MSNNIEGLKKFSFFHVLIIATLAIGLYSNTLKNGFTHDDVVTIVNNFLINDLHNLPKLFDKKSYFALSGELSYRPVVTFTYFMEYAVFGLKSWGYHLTNILLHALNGALFYIFLTLLIQSSTAIRQSIAVYSLNSSPLLASLIFVTHPVITEAVNSISFREDPLVFLFYIAALILYLLMRREDITYSRSSWIYPLSCLIYLLALLTKEMAITFPLIIYCYEWIYRDKEKGVHPILFNNYNIGYIVITLIYIYLRLYYFNNPNEESGLFWPALKTIPWLLQSYLKLAMFPFSLSVYHQTSLVRSIYSLMFIVPSIILILFYATIFMMMKREKGLAFGAIFFIVTLLPVYNLFPITVPFAERYLYVPIAGFAIFAGLVGHLIFNIRKKDSVVIYIFLSFLFILCIYSFAVIKRNVVWKNDYTLWSDAIKKMPNSYHLYRNLGHLYYREGKLKEALQWYQTSFEKNPNDPELPEKIAFIYSKMGLLDDAARFYQAALQVEPNNPTYHFYLANVYYEQGLLNAAIGEYLATLRLNSKFVDAHYNLGNVYLAKGLKDKAKIEFEATLELNPNFREAHLALEILKEESKK